MRARGGCWSSGRRVASAGLVGEGLLRPAAPRSREWVAPEHFLTPTRWHWEPCYGVPVPPAAQPCRPRHGSSARAASAALLGRSGAPRGAALRTSPFPRGAAASLGSWCHTQRLPSRNACAPHTLCQKRVMAVPLTRPHAHPCVGVSRWELVRCESCWEPVPGMSRWKLLCCLCPDGSGCRTHALVTLRVSHVGSALLRLRVFCTYSAGSWCLAHWLCPAGSWCVPCVPPRVLALRVFCWESISPWCPAGSQCVTRVLPAVRASAGSGCIIPVWLGVGPSVCLAGS